VTTKTKTDNTKTTIPESRAWRPDQSDSGSPNPLIGKLVDVSVATGTLVRSAAGAVGGRRQCVSQKGLRPA
jgi:hypothetical protein